MHQPEPRKRVHYDGQDSSIRRVYELLAQRDDLIGLLLHGIVNQYTTAGVSTVWGQITSEWNGVGLGGGMQATLYRSHAREQIGAVERFYDQVLAAGEGGVPVRFYLFLARTHHAAAIRSYERWAYADAIERASAALRALDRAFELLGQPDRLYTPDEYRARAAPVPETSVPLPALRNRLEGLDLEQYRAQAWLFGH
jgi:hypothetical protein